MSTAIQPEAYIAVRNLVVIDFLVKRCKWCGAVIFNSPTKPRTFCDNNNVCCNAFSRSQHKSAGVKKLKLDHAAFEIVEAPVRYQLLVTDGKEKLRRTSLSKHARIPKFGKDLRPSGVSVATRRTQPDLIDINDRPGVSARDDAGYDNRASFVAPLKVKDHLPRPRIKK
jgi:hypothetical protein